MKRRTKIILGSLISLGLVGAVTAKQFPGCGQGHFAKKMVHRISHKLDLNDAQEAELEKLKTNMQEKFQQHHAQRSPVEDILSVFETQLDQDKAMQLLAKRTNMMQENAPDMINALAGFYNTLDAKQQEKVKEMVEKRLNHRGRFFGRGKDNF